MKNCTLFSPNFFAKKKTVSAASYIRNMKIKVEIGGMELPGVCRYLKVSDTTKSCNVTSKRKLLKKKKKIHHIDNKIEDCLDPRKTEMIFEFNNRE